MSEPDPELVTGSPWATLEEARDVWEDAPLEDAILGRLLRVVYPRLLEYAPALPLDVAGVPEAYTHANILAARDLWRHASAQAADPYTIPPAELEPEVRALLRPRRGAPRAR